MNIQMTSVERRTKQISLDNEFFIPIGNLTNLVFGLNATTNQLSTASWAYFGSRYLSSVNASGAGLLRDMGRNYISGGRTFRREDCEEKDAIAEHVHEGVLGDLDHRQHLQPCATAA